MGLNISRIAIIGMGLIGGSLGLAIKAAREEKTEVTGIDTNELTLVKARQRGAADIITADLAEGVAQADMIFVHAGFAGGPVGKKDSALFKARRYLNRYR